MNAAGSVWAGGRQRGCLVSGVLLALALSGGAVPAGAAMITADPLPDQVLAGLRGGLEVGGLRMDLAANLRTYIDNRLALETTARLERYADRHRWVEQRMTVHGITAADAEPASGDAVAASASSGTPPVSGAGPVVATKTVRGDVVQVELPVAGSNGVGTTRISHRIGPEQVFGTVANTANGRSVQQIMDMELRVLNFRSYSEQIHNALRARQMGKAIAR
ncbi:hypothetical protein QWY84_05065 [Aquisalimonas lutea]|uniref:hypothetical protein n=1 Tax=Aquisalimonas lutea TaxID=1327750 RepID=UPI0025B4613C|nr:hypothetical protein [Aquisalimonas lutea]MDN3516979.1 hypothetical protein [Aquisalimonas lutea]